MTYTSLPRVYRLLADTAVFLWREKKLFGGLMLLYAGASYAAVGGISQIDFAAMREATVDVMGGELGALGTAASLLGQAMTGNLVEPASDLEQFLGTLVSFIFWLAVVWAARMRLADKKVKIRDALYSCGAPLISSVFVLVAMMAQALPAIFAVLLLQTVQSNGWAQSGVEAMLAVAATGLVCLLSVYWMTSTFVALVIVTLPRMYPWQALSAASELTIGKRWQIALHIGSMLLILSILWAAVLFAGLLLDNWLKLNWLPLVPVLMQLLGGVTLVSGAVYIYKMYRSLL